MLRTKGFLALALLALMVVGVAGRARALELQQPTADAWRDYMAGVTARLRARVDGGKPFLWIDEEPDRAARLRGGAVLVVPLVGHGTQPVPNGLIHDWIGAVFIPSATIDSLLCVVRDYNRYKEIYKPVVTDSQSLDSSAADQDFSMTWQRHVLFVNAAVRGRYRAHEVTIDSHRGYTVVEATSLQEIQDYGRAGEHLMPPDTGPGFVWRIHCVSRYQERDGGVYLETEVIALSRDIPGSLRWLVGPVVNHLSINSLTATLSETRDAVNTQQVAQERLALRKRKGLN
jgi:hypothetical protein